MRQVELKFVENSEGVEEMLTLAGLDVTLRTTLKTLPGCLHWHVKNGVERGTLEITWHPSQRRLWASVQSGREAPWIDGALQKLSQVD